MRSIFLRGSLALDRRLPTVTYGSVRFEDLSVFGLMIEGVASLSPSCKLYEPEADNLNFQLICLQLPTSILFFLSSILFTHPLFYFLFPLYSILFPVSYFLAPFPFWIDDF
jgi:hypothetical protein